MRINNVNSYNYVEAKLIGFFNRKNNKIPIYLY